MILTLTTSLLCSCRSWLTSCVSFNMISWTDGGRLYIGVMTHSNQLLSNVLGKPKVSARSVHLAPENNGRLVLAFLMTASIWQGYTCGLLSYTHTHTHPHYRYIPKAKGYGYLQGYTLDILSFFADYWILYLSYHFETEDHCGWLSLEALEYFIVILGCLSPMLFIENCKYTTVHDYWHVSDF